MSIFRNRKISANAVMSISAIIIALASVSIAIWEGAETRKHNRLSVRPKLEIHFTTGEDNYGYVLTNNGLGPGIITGRRIFIDEEEIHYSGISGYDELLEKLKLKDYYIAHDAIGEGITIRASDRKNIILFKFSDEGNPETVITQVFSRVRIEISYKSMYNESFVCKIPK